MLGTGHTDVSAAMPVQHSGMVSVPPKHGHQRLSLRLVFFPREHVTMLETLLVVPTGELVLLSPSGQRPAGMPLHVPQCTGEARVTKNDLSSTVYTAEMERL